MKLYGRPLGAVFRDLPWPYKIVVVAAIPFLTFVVVYAPWKMFHSTAPVAVPEPLTVARAGVSARGMLDPSLALDPASGTAWLAYTAEESDGAGGSLFRVRLARAAAPTCENWSAVEGGFEAKRDDLIAPDGQSVFRSGVWRVETPSLVHTPADTGREWKLFAYKYFWPTEPRHRLEVAQHYGMIVTATAPRPEGPWSTEHWLFSPAPDYPPPPYESMILLHLNALHPELADVAAYARPSALTVGEALVLSLSAFARSQDTPDRAVMLLSRDNGQSWLYTGTALNAADLAASGLPPRFLGASLIDDGKGRIYLAAVLGDARGAGLGTYLFPFEDVLRARLRRDAQTGKLAPARVLPLRSAAPGPMGGGFAAYAAGCDVGLLTAEQTQGQNSFTVFKTYAAPPDSAEKK